MMYALFSGMIGDVKRAQVARVPGPGHCLPAALVYKAIPDHLGPDPAGTGTPV
jgi:hypothetical protein